MKYAYIIYTTLFLLFLAIQPAGAQEGSDQENIRITDVAFTVDDDSLLIECRIELTGVEIKTYQSLTLELWIGTEDKKAMLPPVVYAGKLHRRYDERNARLYGQSAPNVPCQVYTDVKRQRLYSLDYRAKIPYGRWLEQATLNLRQTFESNGYVMRNDQTMGELMMNYKL